MIKPILSTLAIGGGCSGVAIVSTSFSNIDENDEITLRYTEDKGRKITTIQTYGEIEAFGQQNGCLFRIVDDKYPNNVKEYSLEEFWMEHNKTFTDLETKAVAVAKSAQPYCKDFGPVFAIFYDSDKKDFKLKKGVSYVVKKAHAIKK
ncbi:hypothetical protein A6V39_04530 [Candidatus Mycoplasma haematobovis]|uniref:Lipoprotein n=1 Tax=Candidatus Mycoplasma haematobovis TaxID=432608 RepID=A0A1A9QDS8_9MOLU|nr:hypothetical protein [Candidatus Mycoplasma haematobovis]OAL10151.1 hypothetical protein A6V39_04530 [Candidatus Mycoplasma haematobovis]